MDKTIKAEHEPMWHPGDSCAGCVDDLRDEIERLGIDLRAWKIRAESSEASLERLKEEWHQSELARIAGIDEIEGLRAALQEARDAVAGEIVMQRGGNGPWIPADPDSPFLALVKRIDAALGDPW